MKVLRIIVINIFLLVLVIFLGEVYSFKEANKFINHKIRYNREKKEFNIENIKEINEQRKPCGLEYKKAPILIYGCSIAYGFGLKEEDSFGNQLSRYTKRPVYNYAIPAKGLQHALYLMKNEPIVKPDPEYVFYVFIADHLRRMYVNCNKIDTFNYLTYKNKKGELVERDTKKSTIFDKSYLALNIQNFSYHILQNVFKEQIYELAKLYFISMKKEITKKYPKAKFVIIEYELGDYTELTEPRIEELNREGIEVLSLNKHFDDELKLDSYKNPVEKDIFRHPNEKAWKLVVEYIAKEYKL